MDTSFQQQQQAAASAGNPAVAVQRLQKELMELMAGDMEGVTAFPSGDDLFAWDATLLGPADTYYAGIEYKLSLTFTHSYPFAAPKVRFVTPCFHPNVAVGGAICLDILGEAWSAVMSVGSVLMSLQALLETPNNNSPLNEAAAKAWDDRAFMRSEALRVAGIAAAATATASGDDDSVPAAAMGGGGGGAAPSEAQTTNANNNPPPAPEQRASSAAAAAAVSMSPQEQRARAHRGESYAGAQPQPPHTGTRAAVPAQ